MYVICQHPIGELQFSVYFGTFLTREAAELWIKLNRSADMVLFIIKLNPV